MDKTGVDEPGLNRGEVYSISSKMGEISTIIYSTRNRTGLKKHTDNDNVSFRSALVGYTSDVHMADMKVMAWVTSRCMMERERTSLLGGYYNLLICIFAKL